MKLHIKITLFMSIIVTSLIFGLGCLTYFQVNKTIENQMGNNAMDLAKTIASMEIIEKNLSEKNKQGIIQSVVEDIRKETRFQYIIVMDMNAIQYSYPYENALYKKYLSGGEKKVLKKSKAYVSADRNKYISAIRAFVPIYYEDNQVGAVLVGLLNDTVNKEVGTYIFHFKLILLIGLILGIFFSSFLAYIIKKSIFGLEPTQIALLLAQSNVVIESIHIGIIAIDIQGKVILFNKAAQKIIAKDGEVLKKGESMQRINSFFYGEIMKSLEKNKTVYDKEIKLKKGKTLLTSFSRLLNPKSELIGYVVSFQDMTKVKRLAEELTGTKELMNNLRAQNHEFMNRLHTISGLIQLEEYDEAVDYISYLSQTHQEIVSLINKQIKIPKIAAILLSKYSKATEAKIQLLMDEKCYLDEIPSQITEDEVCSILGNLVENSIDELCEKDKSHIKIFIQNNKDGLWIQVSDNGEGINSKNLQKIFEKGFSTKKGIRGYGLWIIKKIVEESKGMIELKQNEETIWQIFIPNIKI